MTSYTELLNTIERQSDAALKAHISPDWMQGRTTYGGLSAALCMEAARGLVDEDALPLRAAQFAFVGPVGGDVAVQATLLRQGKNTAFIRAEIVAESGVSTQSIFTFGKPRDSQLDYEAVPMPAVAAPETYVNFFPGGVGPSFAKNFEVHMAMGDRPVSGTTNPTIGLWMRHRDRAAPTNTTSLLALGDAPPPAAMSMLKTPGPVSSMTWYIDFLTADISTDEGWYFAQHTADTAQAGYSSQSMSVWNRVGKPVMLARQMVAVFG